MNASTVPDRKSLKIAAGMRSDEALRKILLRELEIMQYNETCYLQQQDIECLHDFRVAMRRSRILLSRIRGVFPKHDVQHFTVALEQLGRVTGHCRDLDVLLEHWPEYAIEPNAGNQPLYDLLQLHRDKAMSCVVTEFSSLNHVQFKLRWREFLEKESLATRMPYAKQAISVTARDQLDRVLHKVLKSIRHINDKSSDRKIHKLRIVCKRLRYFLEYFQSIGARADVIELIDELKGLQDTLGTYQDLIVHRAVLVSIDGEMNADVRRSLHVIQHELDERIRSQRTDVMEAVNQFLSRRAGEKR